MVPNKKKYAAFKLKVVKYTIKGLISFQKNLNVNSWLA